MFCCFFYIFKFQIPHLFRFFLAFLCVLVLAVCHQTSKGRSPFLESSSSPDLKLPFLTPTMTSSHGSLKEADLFIDVNVINSSEIIYRPPRVMSKGK